MASKLRQSSARVSFFAFQDMITTVTGVLIIVMLMLSLEVTNRAEESTPDPSVTDLQKKLQEAREKLAENMKALQQAQADVSALANRVFVLPKPDNSGRKPVLVVLSANNATCSRLGQSNVENFPLGPAGQGFEQVLASCDNRHERLVLYVRPSGVGQLKACRTLATNRGFDVGWDAAQENQQYLLTP